MFLNILYYIGYNFNNSYYFCIRKDIKNEENAINRDRKTVKERVRADARSIGTQVGCRAQLRPRVGARQTHRQTRQSEPSAQPFQLRNDTVAKTASTMRKALIYYKKDLAGVLTEIEDGYSFQYDGNYLAMPNAEPIPWLSHQAHGPRFKRQQTCHGGFLPTH